MKPTPRPTVKPTAFPTAAPTDICHKTACGKKDRCSEQASCARHEDLHELRCCSDSTKPGWTKRGDSCPWTESNNFATGETDCLHAQTYNQANDFCASIDARLCIADAPADAGSCFNQFTCPPRFICPELGAICTSPPFLILSFRGTTSACPYRRAAAAASASTTRGAAAATPMRAARARSSRTKQPNQGLPRMRGPFRALVDTRVRPGLQ